MDLTIGLPGSGADRIIAGTAEDEITQAAAEIGAQGGKALFSHCDVTSENAVRASIESAVAAFGGVEALPTTFLIDRDGNVVDRYAPTTGPSSIAGDVEKLLG